MRKLFKRVATAVTAMAMVAGMVLVPSTKVLAADGTFCVVGTVVAGKAGDNGWDAKEASANTKMQAGSGNTETYTFATTAGTMYEFALLPIADAATGNWNNKISDGGANFSFFAKEASETTITLSNGTVTWNNLDKNIAPNPAEDYYVVGSMNTWSGDKMTANGDGTYSITYTQIAGDKYEFKVAQDYPTYGWYKAWGTEAGDNVANAEGLTWDYETLTINFDPNTGAITHTAVQAEAPAQEPDTTPAEPENPDATTVTVHIATDWLNPKFYAFIPPATVDGKSTEIAGGWPGAKMTANADNAGYYSAKITLDTVADITVVINGADADANSVQTVNIPLTVKEGKNEFWLTLGGLSEEKDEFGNANYTATVTETAPEGWVASEVGEVETPAETDPADDGDNGDDGDDGDDDDNGAWESAKLKIHFLNSEDWEKVGVYLTYGSWAEITGAWPGAEMELEIGSETWYAIGTNADAEDTYNVIFNNMVSDAEAEEGAVKHQTGDVKDLEAGEYWFVLGEVTKETETQITYEALMFTSVEELEAAGYTYDGEGLAGDLAEDPDDDGDEEEGGDKTTPAETGDMVPVAVMLLGVAAAVAVVASRKRNNA